MQSAGSHEFLKPPAFARGTVNCSTVNVVVIVPPNCPVVRECADPMGLGRASARALARMSYRQG